MPVMSRAGRRAALWLALLVSVSGGWFTAGVAASTAPPAFGTITTSVGGLGEGDPVAVGQQPAGLAVAAGRMVLTDPWMNVVRTFSTGGGAETVLAGTGARGYSGDDGPAVDAALALTTFAGSSPPAGVAIDGAGNVYFSDAGNHVVRKITPAGVVSTVAGTGVAGYTGDDGAATSARLHTPAGLAVDGAGNLYIADAGAHVVRKVFAGMFGVIDTVAGTGSAGSNSATSAVAAQLDAPAGVAIDSAGNLFIADTGNCTVRQVSAGTIATIAGVADSCDYVAGASPTASHLKAPRGVAVDASGNVYVADTGNCIVRKVTLGASPAMSLVAGVAPSDSFTPDCTSAAASGPATSTSLRYPNSVAHDAASGAVLIAEAGAEKLGDQTVVVRGRVRSVAGGTTSTLAGGPPLGLSGDGGPGPSAELRRPTSVVFDSAASGTAYVADSVARAIRTVSTSGTVGTLAVDPPLVEPVALALDGDGNLYVADAQACVVRRINAGDGGSSTIAGTGTCGSSADPGPASAAQLSAPSGLAFSPLNGFLYVADAGNNRVRAIDLAHDTILTVANPTGAPSVLNLPRGLAFDADGDLFIADSVNNRIRELPQGAPSSSLVTVAGTAGQPGSSGDGGAAETAKLGTPYGLATDGAGTLYVTDRQSHTVRQIGGDGVIRLVAGTPGLPGFAGDGGAASAARLDTPLAVTVAPDGSLWLSDSLNARVRSIALASADASSSSSMTASSSSSSSSGSTSPDGTLRAGAGAAQGYVLVGQDGTVHAFGSAAHRGDMTGTALNAPVIGAAYAPGGDGYWLVAKDGGIFSFGSAQFHGSMGGTTLNAEVLGMQATPSGQGYWLFAGDGGIFSFGDAAFFGSMGGAPLNSPVVQMEPLASGTGYWLVAGDGGIFSFGAAQFFGSTGDLVLNQPVFDMTSTARDGGYWLVGRDGGVFSFGDAASRYYGSAVTAEPPPTQVIGMDATPTSEGYWIADAGGKVYPFGDADFLGDRAGASGSASMVAFAAVPA